MALASDRCGVLAARPRRVRRGPGGHRQAPRGRALAGERGLRPCSSGITAAGPRSDGPGPGRGGRRGDAAAHGGARLRTTSTRSRSRSGAGCEATPSGPRPPLPAPGAAVALAVCALGGSVGTRGRRPQRRRSSRSGASTRSGALGEAVRRPDRLLQPADGPAARRRRSRPTAAAADQRVDRGLGGRPPRRGRRPRPLADVPDETAHPHTGHAAATTPASPRIPAAAVSTRDAGVLSALLEKEKEVSVSLRLDCRERGPGRLGQRRRRA
ncbi:MAG: hypothetical protein MZV70_66930 [Desulfobacterales bacterium]|nr:hypothetical protein [Desulfobacterales bacterium]